MIFCPGCDVEMVDSELDSHSKSLPICALLMCFAGLCAAIIALMAAMSAFSSTPKENTAACLLFSASRTWRVASLISSGESCSGYPSVIRTMMGR